MAQFDWVPYLQGKRYTYYEWYSMLGSLYLFIFAMINILIFLILSRISNMKQIQLRAMMTSQKESQQQQLLLENGIKRLNANSVIDKIKNITYYTAFISLSGIPVVFSALDVIYIFQGMIGMFSILLLGIVLANGIRNWSIIDEQQKSGLFSARLINRVIRKCLSLDQTSKKHIKSALIFSIVMPIFVYKSCICFFNQEVKLLSLGYIWSWNTYWTRLAEFKRSCPPGPPCQIYATVPQNPEVAFFLNIHTNQQVDKVTVFYQELQTSNPNKFINITADSFEYPSIQWNFRRKVHSALILDLKPDTKYLLKVFYQGQFWTNKIYKTLPSKVSKQRPIRMINAGDSGYTNAAVKLSKVVATLKPDIFFMGGDIAYDNNIPACAFTWDYFLGMYGKITATTGYLMPIVVSVGNHDVGLNQLSHTNITLDQNGPALFIYFPQHYDYNLDGHIVKQVPPISRRRSFTNFTFANVHFLCLDSGYLHSFDGYQKRFLVSSLNSNLDKIKFINYHVPIYSACESFDKNPQRFLYALFHWVPNFDKYRVMTVFQNHVHSFKRTKPLIGSTPSQNGTVYLGDGAYGALISEFCKPDATVDIFNKHSKNNNFWLSEVFQDQVIHSAYNTKGQIIDTFVQKKSSYVY